MRIIAGDFKGRRLYTPSDREIRPTTDKVKEAIFSMIAAALCDAVVLDLFAGSGNLGLEAVSRGARICYFGDSARESLALIRKNVEYCRAENQSVIRAGDYRKVLAGLPEQADVILLDPPYKKGLTADCLSAIEEYDVLAEGGLIVAEHSKEETLPEAAGSLEKIKEKKYGTICVALYRRRDSI